MAAAMMRALVVAMSVVLPQAAQLHSRQKLQSFSSFVQEHGRAYQQGSTEYASRQFIYEQRLAAAKRQNSLANRSWTAGVNKFWDWSEAETMSLRGWDGSMTAGGHSVKPHTAFLQQKMALPEDKLWTDLAAMKNVKNQGSCGSCWAVSSATVLSAHVEIHTKQVRSFSAEQIVHCTANPKHCGGDGGCKGATAELAMDYVLKHGCATAEDVPYSGTDGACTSGSASNDMSSLLAEGSLVQTNAGNAFGMTGWETLPKNEYEPLVRALAERGPVAVSVAADQWFNYESGIFNGCGKDNVIDHAVTAIGYGVDAGKPYWTIQNSWGADWGESGTIRLERHPEGGYCGMNNDPQKGIACQGETDPVPVCGMCGVLFDSVVPHFG
jgi:cathepsin L